MKLVVAHLVKKFPASYGAYYIEKSPLLFPSLNPNKPFQDSTDIFFMAAVAGKTTLQKLQNWTGLASFVSQKILHLEYDSNFDRHFIKNIFVITDSAMFYLMGEDEKNYHYTSVPLSEMLMKTKY